MNLNKLRRLTLSLLADPEQVRDPRRCLCPLCGHVGRFWSVGRPPRRNRLCPACQSLDRHRLLGLYLQENRDVIDQRAVLHFAPEAPLREFLRRRYEPERYVTADAGQGKADVQVDMTRMSLPDGSYDAVIANHVLEHIPDDAAAFAEVFRVLRHGGVFMTTVPIIDGWPATYENERIRDASERQVHFGQRDHVRFYGSDFVERFQKTGFTVARFVAAPERAVRHGLVFGETLFIGHKATRGADALACSPQRARFAPYPGERRAQHGSLAMPASEALF